MDPLIIVIVLAVGLGLAAAFLWFSRSSMEDELAELRSALEEAKKAGSASRKEVKEKTEDKKGRGEELRELREKLKDAKRRLHESQEEEKQARELASARAQELREAERAEANAREEAGRLAADLKRLEDRQGAGQKPERRRPVEAPPAPTVAATSATTGATTSATTVEGEAGGEVAIAPAPPAAPRPPPAAGPISDDRAAQLELRIAAADDKAERSRRDASEYRRKAEDAAEELKRVRGKFDANAKVLLVTKGEAEIWKAKFAGLEAKWNDIARELQDIGWKPRAERAAEDRDRKRGGKPGARRGEAKAGGTDVAGAPSAAGTAESAPQPAGSVSAELSAAAERFWSDPSPGAPA